MKINYTARLMVTGLFLLLFNCSNAFAQAGYTGGQGGGYASISIITGTLPINNDTLVNKEFEVSIYPNPLKRSETLNAKFSGVKSNHTISVIVTDMIGSRLLSEQYNASSEIAISLPQERLSKGIYLITFEYKGKRKTRRFTFSD